MDLIGALSSKLGVDAGQAQALAGMVMGTVQKQVAANAEPAKAREVAAAIPEIDAWKAKAAEVVSDGDDGDGGWMDSLMGAATSGVGQQLLGALGGKEAQEKAQFIALIDKLGLEPSHAAVAGPVVMDFLKARLGSDLFSTLLDNAPMITSMMGFAPDPEPEPEPEDEGIAGAAANLLGKLF